MNDQSFETLVVLLFGHMPVFMPVKCRINATIENEDCLDQTSHIEERKVSCH